MRMNVVDTGNRLANSTGDTPNAYHPFFREQVNLLLKFRDDVGLYG